MFNKKIPTIIGVLVLIGGLIAGVILVGRTALLSTRAGPTALPRNVEVINIDSDSFAVAWTTDTAVTGFVKYSDNPANLNLTVADTRDQLSGSTGSYTTHFIEVSGLTANQTYYFKVGSGSQTYDDGGSPYQIKTVKQATTPAEDIISGRILLPSGQPAGGALVFVNIEGGQTLGALSTNSGSWRVNLASARDNAGQFARYDKAEESLTIFVDAGRTGTATALTNTGNDSPVPDITLGQTHNFVAGTTTPLATTNQQQSSSFDNLDNSPEATLSVKLTYPAVGGEKIATSTPEFRGTGPAGTVLTLILDPLVTASQSAVATIDAAGRWAQTFLKALDLGGHTIMVEYSDEAEVKQKITRVFSIVEAGVGGVPAFTATGSAEATGSGTATQSSMPATDSGLMDVGVTMPTYLILGLGSLMFVGGVWWRKRLGLVWDEP